MSDSQPLEEGDNPGRRRAHLASSNRSSTRAVVAQRGARQITVDGAEEGALNMIVKIILLNYYPLGSSFYLFLTKLSFHCAALKQGPGLEILEYLGYSPEYPKSLFFFSFNSQCLFSDPISHIMV